MRKSTLAVELSKVRGFHKPTPALEQYITPSEIAADIIHSATLHKDIENKHVLDLGCGTGILGIGAGIVGASKVTFLDIDSDALDTLQVNLKEYEFTCEVIHSPLRVVDADTVVMNPPFGTKRRHADKQFLLAAMQSAHVVYSIHLAGSEEFIDSLAQTKGFVRTHTQSYSFRLPATMPKHTKDATSIDVILVRLQQQRL